MKAIRKISKAVAYILVAAIFNLHFTSCTSENDVQNMAKQFTAEEVFRGLVFLQGDFAEKVPTLKSLRAQQEVMFESAMSSANRDENKGVSLFGDYESFDAEKKAVADFFTNEIYKLNPNYFMDLKSAIDSRDVESIRSQLRAAGSLIQIVLMKSEKFSQLNALVELAKAEGGIDIANYDLSNPQEVAQYNADVENFARTYHPEFLTIEKSAAVMVVAVIVVWAFAVVGVLALVAMAGVLAVAYFIAGTIYVVMHNRVIYKSRAITQNGPTADFLENQLIAELIALNNP